MILVVDPLKELAERLREARPELRFDHRTDLSGAERFLDERATEVEAVVLGPALGQEEALDVGEKLHEQRPTISLILTAMAEGPALYRRAMRAGIADVLSWDAEIDEIRDVLDRAVASHTRLLAVERVDDQAPLATTITTFSTKGGCGKSFVATNLAVLLAQKYPGEVVLVDLDLQAGDIAVMLQLIPERTILDAAEMAELLDEEALAGFLSRMRDPDLKILAAPPTPVHAEEVRPEDVVRILGVLRKMFRWVIIDGPPFFTEQMLGALDLVDSVLVLSSLDVPSIKNLKLSVQTLRELGIPRERMRLVLNRADSKVGLTVREVEKSLGTTIDCQIPSSREVPYAVNQGIPIVTARPKAPVSRALREILDVVEGQVAHGASARAEEAADTPAWTTRLRRRE